MRLGVWTNPSNGARWQLDLGPTAARRNWLIAKRWLSSVRSCDYNAYFFTRVAPGLVGPWLSELARLEALSVRMRPMRASTQRPSRASRTGRMQVVARTPSRPDQCCQFHSRGRCSLRARSSNLEGAKYIAAHNSHNRARLDIERVVVADDFTQFANHQVQHLE
jgi:hypothetical protein